MIAYLYFYFAGHVVDSGQIIRGVMFALVLAMALVSFAGCGFIEGVRQSNNDAPSSRPIHVNKPHGSVWDGGPRRLRDNYNEEGE